MPTSCWIWVWKLGVVSLVAMGGAIASGNCTSAQITPDGTLGAESSVVTPNVDIKGIPSDRIEGGAIRGANLFHSFREFNINEGRGAYFTNPAGIENILSRVTGGNPSNIFGKLGVLGNANLFFINPNGIIFGPNASLDVGGSFVGSTASSLKFSDGTEFSATATQTTPLLTISVPLGLQFGGNQGSIRNQSRATNSSGGLVGLAVQPGKTLALLGGNVSLDGGILFAPGGFVELGGLAGEGTVGLSVDGNNLSWSFPDALDRADVSLTNGARVAVFSSGGGSIAVNARNLDITSGSYLGAGIGQGLESPGAQAGDITINATEKIALSNNGYVFNTVPSGAVGNAGNIKIQAGSLSLSNNAGVNASTSGQGNAGSISVQANGSVSVANLSGIFSNVSNTGVGNAGNIDILAGSLSLSDRSFLDAATSGQGNAGSVSVQANGSVSIANTSAMFSNVSNTGVGNAGNIDILAGSLSLTDTSFLGAGTSGRGDAGSVSVRATGSVSIANNSSISSSLSSTGVGRGGNIDILAGSLSLNNVAQLRTGTFGQGDAGSIFVRASDSVSLANNSLIGTTVLEGAVGKGGNIDILAGSLSLTDSSTLFSATLGRGNAGSVFVRASGSVSLANSRVFSLVDSGAVGKGGDINIIARSLSLTNEASLNASTLGQGDAGSVFIKTTDSAFLSNSDITSSTANISSDSILGEGNPVGRAGNINILTGTLTLTDESNLYTLTSGLGDAGSVSISATGSVLLEKDSGIGSFVSGIIGGRGIGKGGDINIRALSLSLDESLLLTNTSGQGNAGNVFLQTDESVSLTNNSRVASFVAPTAVGNGGDIEVQTRSLSLTTGSDLFSGVVGEQEFGSLFDSSSLQEILSNLPRPQDILPGGQGQGGNIRVNATDSVTFSGIGRDGRSSGLVSSTGIGASGRAGDVTVNTGALRIADGAAVNAQTQNASDGGNVKIAARRLTVQNGGQVTVSSQASGKPGSLDVTADSILLDNNGQFRAEGASGDGGDITLQAQDFLQLRRNSQISTTAGTAQAGGNGGNITINTPFIVAVPDENSDITANAFTGNGGRVEITASSIFGTQFRPQLTRASDITASSTFGVSGAVEINTPDFDPNQGLVTLPAELVDASNQIASRSCPTGGENKFTIAGRGGLPPNPRDPLGGEAVLTNWATLSGQRSSGTIPDRDKGAGNRGTNSTNSTSSTPTTIVEATGWMTNDKGEVVLTATAPTTTPDIPWLPSSGCHAPKPSS